MEMFQYVSIRHVMAGALFIIVTAFLGILNAAESWTAPVKINDNAGFEKHLNPDIEIDPNGYIYAVWEDWRNDSSDVYFSRSTDGGATWSANTKVNPSSGVDEPDVAVDAAGTICVVWRQLSDKDIYSARSTDGGASWETPVKVSGGSDPRAQPCIVADQRVGKEGHFIAAWMHNQVDPWHEGIVYHYEDIYAACSFDGGASWGGSALVTKGSTPQDKRTSYPELAIYGTKVRIVYYSSYADEEIYRASADLPDSTSQPFEWSNSFSVSGKWGVELPGADIAFDANGNSYVGFAGYSTNPYPPEYGEPYEDIYGAIVRSANGLKDVDDQSSIANNFYRDPTVAAYGDGNACAAWNDVREGTIYRSVYFTETSDGGTTWSANIKINEATHAAEDPDMAADANGTLYMIWLDKFKTKAYYDVVFSRRGEPLSPGQAQVDLNDTSFGTGDQITATFNLNEDITTPFTAFAVLILPNGSMLNARTLDAPPRPVATGIPGLSEGFSYPLLNTAIPAGAPKGTYEIAVVFFAANAPITGRNDAFLDVSSTFTVE
jgi:hypothetical protein